MGRRGTEVARAAADIVLLRDDFTALVSTISEGRRVFGNIQHALGYLTGFKFTLVALPCSRRSSEYPFFCRRSCWHGWN
jgi:Ca2+-transporting ATPase